MGNCLDSCCGSSDKTIYEEGARTTGTSSDYAPPRSSRPDTEKDKAARASAAEAAQARQSKFEQSPGGKAAMKSVKAVKAERDAAKQRPDVKDTAGDWLS